MNQIIQNLAFLTCAKNLISKEKVTKGMKTVFKDPCFITPETKPKMREKARDNLLLFDF